MECNKKNCWEEDKKEKKTQKRPQKKLVFAARRKMRSKKLVRINIRRVEQLRVLIRLASR